MPRTIGLLSDIHGNLTALRAVLADAAALGVTEFWSLGDVVTPGPGARDVLAALDDVAVTVWVRGNWDDNVVRSVRGEGDPGSPSVVYAACLAKCVYAEIGDDGVNRIAGWPLADTRTLDGLTVLACHQLPQKNAGRDLIWHAPQTNFDALFAEGAAEIAITGHTHVQMVRYSTDGRMIVNPGSVGQPYAFLAGRLGGDLRAQYALLRTSEAGLAEVDLRRVPYDASAEQERAARADAPYVELYGEFLTIGRSYDNFDARLAGLSRAHGYDAVARAFLSDRLEAARRRDRRDAH